MNEERAQMEEMERGGNRRILEEIREFQEVFPEAAENPRSIPQEVWDEVRKGRSLVGAYARFVNGRSRRELEELRHRQSAARQNEENASRALGSMHTGELGLGTMDAFLRGFQD